jgi:hypothetical protein
MTDARSTTSAGNLKVFAQSREARDGVLKSGMESGVARSYDRLAEILA